MKKETQVTAIGILSLVVFVLLLFMTLYLIYVISNETIDESVESGIYWILGTACIKFLLGIGFSVLLLLGVKKNKPGYICAYFVYGIIISIPLVINVCLTITTVSGIVLLIVTVAYIASLVQIRSLYVSMKNEQMVAIDKQNLL